MEIAQVIRFKWELLRMVGRAKLRLDGAARESTCHLRFVPSGTIENSPPFQRWVMNPGIRESRQGRQTSFVPDGTFEFGPVADPPLKRWAILGCP